MHWNPLHWDYQVWQWFFVVSGVWNLIGATDGLLRPALNLEKYYNVKTDDYYTLFLNRSFWWCVLIFGVGYLLIAYDPVLFYGIIVMGIIGKVIVAANWYYLYLRGRAQTAVIFGATGDSIFTVFFVLALFSDVLSR